MSNLQTVQEPSAQWATVVSKKKNQTEVATEQRLTNGPMAAFADQNNIHLALQLPINRPALTLANENFPSLSVTQSSDSSSSQSADVTTKKNRKKSKASNLHLIEGTSQVNHANQSVSSRSECESMATNSNMVSESLTSSLGKVLFF